MPAGMLPGPATLAFGLRDDGGEAVGSMQQAPGETAQVVRSRPVAAFTVTEEMTVFDDTLALTGATFRPVATPGAALNVELAWMPLGEPEQDYRIRLVLVDGASGAEAVAQTFGLWPDLYPPTQWRTLEPVTTLHGLRIPVDFEASTPLELRVEVLPGQGRGDSPVPSSGAGAELGMVEVDVRKRIFELPQLAQRVDAQFGDAIHLAGYELDTSQARPGGSVSMTLVWQAIKTPDDNYTVFNHLVGEDGLNAGQFDAPPVGEAWLTETWLPGEVVVEEREIPIDEAAIAGEVQLIVGLYNADDLQRLPVVLNGEPQAGDQLLLDRFLISAAAADQP